MSISNSSPRDATNCRWFVTCPQSVNQKRRECITALRRRLLQKRAETHCSSPLSSSFHRSCPSLTTLKLFYLLFIYLFILILVHIKNYNGWKNPVSQFIHASCVQVGSFGFHCKFNQFLCTYYYFYYYLKFSIVY